MPSFLPLPAILLAVGLVGCSGADKPTDLSSDATPYKATRYEDPQEQQQFKDALSRAGIPATTAMIDGREVVRWSPADAERVQHVQDTLFGKEPPDGLHVSFGSSEAQEAFIAWLVENQIPFEIVTNRGRDYVVWQAKDDERVRKWPELHLPPRQSEHAP